VNGIDGMIAWSTGVAEASGRRTLALFGDVTAAHDIGSLQLLRKRKLPLTLVILDNAGGRIFDHLPVGSSISAADMRFWTTPPDIDLPAICAAFGLNVVRVGTEEALKAALEQTRHSQVPQVIIVSTDPTTTADFLAAARQGPSE
jgi:2-succinyl-5-enolpyruvyl-6-hydroxy-3-cyclohexene-1-carboxylate synthase